MFKKMNNNKIPSDRYFVVLKVVFKKEIFSSIYCKTTKITQNPEIKF